MRNIPKYFRVESSDNTLIFSAVSSINMLFEEDVRGECALLIDQLSQQNATNLVIDLGAVARPSHLIGCMQTNAITTYCASSEQAPN